jgi:hypothetical protein
MRQLRYKYDMAGTDVLRQYASTPRLRGWLALCLGMCLNRK